MLKSSTLRPGLLVSLKTTLKGNVDYAKETIAEDHTTDDGAREAEWKTKRTVHNPDEHERAVEVRGKARSLITGTCVPSLFGYLCPNTQQEQFELALREANRLVDEFNDTATRERIGFYVLTGRIANDDLSAIRAIRSEVADLIAELETNVQKLDVKAIRATASKGVGLSKMLTDSGSKPLQEAIDAARKAANGFAAQLKDAGTQAALVVDQATIASLRESRGAFLDFGEQADIEAAPIVERALDLVPDETEIACDLPPDEIEAPVQAVAIPVIEF
jgi:hypothetical protein